MAWNPTIPAEPPVRPGWWAELSFDRWVNSVAAEMRAAEQAEKIEHLKALAHRVDMAAAGALSADRWEKIQQRRDLQDAVYRPGLGLVSQTGAREVEHRACGQILGVR